MLVNLDKEGLICLVNDISPNYDLVEEMQNYGYGHYTGSYGTWDWDLYKLGQLSEQDLFHIFNKCKNSLNRTY